MPFMRPVKFQTRRQIPRHPRRPQPSWSLRLVNLNETVFAMAQFDQIVLAQSPLWNLRAPSSVGGFDCRNEVMGSG